MKKIFIAMCGFATATLFSQISIGKASISTLSDNITINPSISLEFGIGNKGIVLPWVNGVSNASPFITGYSGSQSVVNGTIVFDKNDKKVKYLKSGSWFDLTVDTTGAADTLQDTLTENTNAKAVIGSTGATDTTPGILVLTDANKAMVLPKVAQPHLNIKNPAPGMMVYDTTNKQLAVYNGTVWSLWKP